MKIESIVFPDQKYDGDSLNSFTHENSFFSSEGKRRDACIFIPILEGRMIVTSGNSFLRTLTFFPS